MRGTKSAALLAALLLQACPRKEEGSAAVPPPPPAGAPSIRLEKLTILPPAESPLRADAPSTFRLGSIPPLPPDAAVGWTFTSPRERLSRTGRGPSIDVSLPSGGVYTVQAQVGSTGSNTVEVRVYRVLLLDAEDRPLREGPIALPVQDAFDARGRLREEAVAAAPDRVRVLVEDPASGAPASVGVSSRLSDPPLMLPLAGPPERRVTRPFLLLADRDDALAGIGSALLASPGGRVEFRYRDAPAGGVRVGPAAVHEIPVRFVAVGPGMPPLGEIEKVAALRLAQANAVWEPLGRRFTRGAVVRVETFPGLFLIRGRAAGADGQGRASRCGVLIDGREVSVPAAWRNDGAPMTPKATARALIEKAGKSFQVEQFENLLAGDREAVVLRVRRRDGSPAAVDRIVEGNDVSQAVTPLPGEGLDSIEVAPTADLLSLEEIALLASGKGPPSQGFDVFIVKELHSLQERSAFKVYPEGLFPASMAGSAVVSWPILDGTGRFPFGLACVAGELLLPPGVRPSAEDTLFARPLSEAPGVDARKRVTATTGARIAERGRGLSSRK
jgi:hypothetical protein